MTDIIRYQHHGIEVAVREHLRGKHKDYCLCWMCENYHPETPEKNCRTANLLFAIDVLCNLVTPVWECPNYCLRFDMRPDKEAGVRVKEEK